MWVPRRLITLWASTACYRDSFNYGCNYMNLHIPYRIFFKINASYISCHTSSFSYDIWGKWCSSILALYKVRVYTGPIWTEIIFSWMSHFTQIHWVVPWRRNGLWHLSIKVYIFRLLPYFEENGSRLMRSPCCLWGCESHSPLLTFESLNKSLWKLVYILWHVYPLLGNDSVNTFPSKRTCATIGCPLLGHGPVNTPP
jgi:hypothetical protein